MGISICLLSLGSRMSGCPPCLGVIQEPEKDTEQGSREPGQGRVLTSCFQAVHSGPSHLTSLDVNILRSYSSSNTVKGTKA